MTLSGISFRIILKNQLSEDFRVLAVFGLLLEAYCPFCSEALLCASCLVSTFRQRTFRTTLNTIQISDSRLFSMFGLAHNVQSAEVRASCTAEDGTYPQLLPDIQKEGNGLTSLICDRVIDVELLLEPVVVDNQVEEFPLLPDGETANRA
jgi:hypothetical protein